MFVNAQRFVAVTFFSRIHFNDLMFKNISTQCKFVGNEWPCKLEMISTPDNMRLMVHASERTTVHRHSTRRRQVHRLAARWFRWRLLVGLLSAQATVDAVQLQMCVKKEVIMFYGNCVLIMVACFQSPLTFTKPANWCLCLWKSDWNSDLAASTKYQLASLISHCCCQVNICAPSDGSKQTGFLSA
jgi:hypothetical protein